MQKKRKKPAHNSLHCGERAGRGIILRVNMACATGSIGHALRKEDMPMRHFLRDIAAAVIAAVIAAMLLRLMDG